MTVICWDGKTLAADKLSDHGGLIRKCTKIYRAELGLFGCSGYMSSAAELLGWLMSGALPEKMPANQGTDDFCTIMLVRPDKTIWHFARGPHPFQLEVPFHAIGSGQDFAIAAMALGQTAVRAVEVASQYCTGCGEGVDSLEF